MDVAMETVEWTPFTTPLGEAYIAATEEGICHVVIPHKQREHFVVWLHDHFSPEQIQAHPRRSVEAIEQLDAYWKGERRRFELHLDLHGTTFQKRVWDALLRIPYGQTVTYAQLADQVGRPDAYQAVGRAVGANPVPVIVPCHRVVGADGALVGYSAGIDTKEWLLQHEGVLLL